MCDLTGGEILETRQPIFSRGSSNDRASVCSGDDAGSIPAPGSYEPYGAVGILGYPGWCVPVDMRRDNL